MLSYLGQVLNHQEWWDESRISFWTLIPSPIYRRWLWFILESGLNASDTFSWWIILCNGGRVAKSLAQRHRVTSLRYQTHLLPWKKLPSLVLLRIKLFLFGYSIRQFKLDLMILNFFFRRDIVILGQIHLTASIKYWVLNGLFDHGNYCWRICAIELYRDPICVTSISLNTTLTVSGWQRRDKWGLTEYRQLFIIKTV